MTTAPKANAITIMITATASMDTESCPSQTATSSAILSRVMMKHREAVRDTSTTYFYQKMIWCMIYSSTEQFSPAETGETPQLPTSTTITSASTELLTRSSTEQAIRLEQTRVSKMLLEMWHSMQCTFRAACSAAETPALHSIQTFPAAVSSLLSIMML